MLTDEQARRFCGCGWCYGKGTRSRYGIDGEKVEDFDCAPCSGSGIDPAKRTKLEELLRTAQESAWSEGYQEGCSDGAAGQCGMLRSPDNPYAKARTNA